MILNSFIDASKWLVHRHDIKNRLINGIYHLPCLSGLYCEWLLQKWPWKNQRK